MLFALDFSDDFLSLCVLKKTSGNFFIRYLIKMIRLLKTENREQSHKKIY